MNPTAWRLPTRLLAAIVSGGALFCAFPPVDIGWIALAAPIPLLLALRGARGRAGFVIGFIFGAAFFGPLVWWISLFGFLPWAALVVAMALATAFFGWFAAWASRWGPGRLVAVPLMFVAVEVLRTGWPFGGFAWGGLGYTQHDDLPMLPLARIGGVHLVSLAIVAFAALVAQAIASGRIWRRALAVVVAGGIAVGPMWLPLGLAGESRGTFDVAMIQGNVPEGSFTGFADRVSRTGPEDLTIFNNHLTLSEQLASNPPNLVVWPENAVDRDPFTNRDMGLRLEDVIRRVGAPFVVGAILQPSSGPGFRNRNILYSSQGLPIASYDKVHLVPFGEYVPWAKLREYIPDLEQIPEDGIPGKEAVVFDVGGARLGTVICFESTYPRHVREFVAGGAEFIIVSTNNASFRRSPAARQHVQMSAMRAVEQGRWVMHAAISGITAVIDPEGRIVERTDLFEQAIVRHDIERTGGRTIYGRFGEPIELGFLGLGVIASIVTISRMVGNRRSRRYEQVELELWGGEEALHTYVAAVDPRPIVPLGSAREPAVEESEPRSEPADPLQPRDEDGT